MYVLGTNIVALIRETELDLRGGLSLLKGSKDASRTAQKNRNTASRPAADAAQHATREQLRHLVPDQMSKSLNSMFSFHVIYHVYLRSNISIQTFAPADREVPVATVYLELHAISSVPAWVGEDARYAKRDEDMATQPSAKGVPGGRVCVVDGR